MSDVECRAAYTVGWEIKEDDVAPSSTRKAGNSERVQSAIMKFNKNALRRSKTRPMVGVYCSPTRVNVN